MSVWLVLAIIFSFLFLLIGGVLIWAILNNAFDDKNKDEMMGLGCFIILDGIIFIGALIFWIVFLFRIGVFHW
jgi:hypothetical protein